MKFMLVGLGDKAVAESRERVRAAFAGLGLAMPSKRIIANLAAPSLIAVVNHFRGTQILSPPKPGPMMVPDLRDVKGQENAKRALEIAAAGGHNLLFSGPPGSGKSMMAARLPGLLPPLSPAELLETSMVHSVAGLIARGALTRTRPFRTPHHSASMAALTGGGLKVKPGEVSLAHNGVLFLDELPEFSSQALDSLRQPLETGEVVVARANAHVRYPARFQLVAAQNPCKCGMGGAGRGACGRAPRCQTDYQMKVSGPFMDRIDLQIDVPPVSAADLALPAPAEGTEQAAARQLQADRAGDDGARLNAQAQGDFLEKIADLDPAGRALLAKAAEAGGLTARGWTRALGLARTIADLEGAGPVRRIHVAEALIYRRMGQPAPALV